MPNWAQTITLFLPPRYFVDILRAVYLRGATFLDLWDSYLALALFAFVFNLLAMVTYKKRA